MVNKAAAGRAHRGGGDRPQAAGAARREGRVDRRRADRAGAQAGRRREDGDGVPVQAHAAADQLHRQPDLPDPDREPRGRPARAARPEVDALALPPLPARGRHPPARARAGGAAASGSTCSRASRRSSTRSTRSSGSSASRTASRTRPSKIIKRFGLDAEQTDAILELKLYRLARLEILVIQQGAGGEAEAGAADRRAAQGRGRAAGSWCATRSTRSSRSTAARRPIARRTRIEAAGEEVEYTADDFIVEEDNVVIVSRDGWVKRQKEVRDLATTRLREGDAVLAVLAGQHAGDGRRSSPTSAWPTPAGSSTCPPRPATASRCRACSSSGTASGWWPRFSLDPRVTATIGRREGDPPPIHALAVTSDGYSLRFGLEPFVEPSTRAGRRFARPAEGAEVVGVAGSTAAKRSSRPRGRRGRCCARSTRSTTCRARARA